MVYVFQCSFFFFTSDAGFVFWFCFILLLTRTNSARAPYARYGVSPLSFLSWSERVALGAGAFITMRSVLALQDLE